jgi:hypothetical protein
MSLARLAALVPTTSFEVREVARDGTVSSARSHIAIGLRIVSLRDLTAHMENEA